MLHGNKKYKNYLITTQRAVIRIDTDKTPADIEGLCTDGLRTCTCIVVIADNRKRMSLIHTDAAVKEDAIIDECRWVNDSCTLHFIKGAIYANPAHEARWKTTTIVRRLEEAAKKSGIKIQIKHSKELAWAVVVTRSGEIAKFYQPSEDKQAFVEERLKAIKQSSDTSYHDNVPQAAPYIEFRHAITVLNINIANELNHSSDPRNYLGLDLQFDSQSWTPITRIRKESLTFLSHAQSSEFSFSFFNRSSMVITSHTADYQALVDKYQSQIRQNTDKGESFNTAKDYLKAALSFKKALNLSYLLGEEEDLEKANLCFKLGSAYRGMSKHDDACEYFSKAHALYSALSGDQNANAQKAKRQYDEVMQLKQENKEEVTKTKDASGLVKDLAQLSITNSPKGKAKDDEVVNQISLNEQKSESEKANSNIPATPPDYTAGKKLIL